MSILLQHIIKFQAGFKELEYTELVQDKVIAGKLKQK